jgi:hypothetical protein
MHNFFRDNDGSGMPPIVAGRARCDQYDGLWSRTAADASARAVTHLLVIGRQCELKILYHYEAMALILAFIANHLSARYWDAAGYTL